MEKEKIFDVRHANFVQERGYRIKVVISLRVQGLQKIIG
jgi:hypothetical protein